MLWSRRDKQDDKDSLGNLIVQYIVLFTHEARSLDHCLINKLVMALVRLCRC